MVVIDNSLSRFYFFYLFKKNHFSLIILTDYISDPDIHHAGASKVFLRHLVHFFRPVWSFQTEKIHFLHKQKSALLFFDSTNSQATYESFSV